MTKETFQNQMRRLADTYGDKAYSNERQKVIWLTFQRNSDEEFIDTVTYLIGHCRALPLMKEFNDAMRESELQTKQRLRQFSPVGGIVETLEAQYNAASYDDPNLRERILARIRLVKEYASQKITKRQFEEGLEFYGTFIKN